MNYRTNAGQVTRARVYYGKRPHESNYEHRKTKPNARQCEGKGSMWTHHRHDIDEPMDTYVPTTCTPPRG